MSKNKFENPTIKRGNIPTDIAEKDYPTPVVRENPFVDQEKINSILRQLEQSDTPPDSLINAIDQQETKAKIAHWHEGDKEVSIAVADLKAALPIAAKYDTMLAKSIQKKMYEAQDPENMGQLAFVIDPLPGSYEDIQKYLKAAYNRPYRTLLAVSTGVKKVTNFVAKLFKRKNKSKKIEKTIDIAKAVDDYKNKLEQNRLPKLTSENEVGATINDSTQINVESNSSAFSDMLYSENPESEALQANWRQVILEKNESGNTGRLFAKGELIDFGDIESKAHFVAGTEYKIGVDKKGEDKMISIVAETRNGDLVYEYTKQTKNGSKKEYQFISKQRLYERLTANA